MKKFILTVAVFLLLINATYPQSVNKAAQLQEIIAAVNLPGIQLIYTKNNRQEVYNIGTIANGSTQRITSNTIFEAASLSKSVFTYVVLRLYDRGLIDLDKPLLQYIGKYNRFDSTDNRYNKITARIVLRHTTGLPNWGDKTGAKLMFTPDSCFSYSGEGYTFLQKVIEQITNRSLNQLAMEEVFVPLKMTNSSYEWTSKFDSISSFGNSADQIKRHATQNAAYSLLTNAHDYNLFLQASIACKGLKPQTHQLMMEKSTAANWFHHKVTEANKHINWALGAGLQQNEKGSSIWHWGDNGNFKAFYIVYPKTHESLVYFTHNERGLFVTSDIINLFFGEQTTWAIKWIGEGYDSPYAMKIYRAALLKNGFEHSKQILDSLKLKDTDIDISEHDLNEFGFILMDEDKFKDAENLFELNISLNPNSSNAYDSLAEAYQKIGNNKLAIENFKRCLELNSENDYAREQLKKLQSSNNN